MQILLPPSQTKRDGGADGSALKLATLGFPTLTPTRTAVLRAVTVLAGDPVAMTAALRLGSTQGGEVARNRKVRRSPVLPALLRYTGVLYDWLDPATLPQSARGFASENVVIHSALFGLLRADDLIPAYRLAHDARLPELSLAKVWPGPISAALAGCPGLILDLRSEAYVALGPPPPGSYYLRLVSAGPDGQRRALNHFNKKGKGQFVRALVEAGTDHSEIGSVLSWAAAAGFDLSLAAPNELTLLV